MNSFEHGDLICFNLRLYHQVRKLCPVSNSDFWGGREESGMTVWAEITYL